MNGLLTLTDLTLSVFIGVYPEEKKKKQHLTLSVEMGVAIPKVDSLDRTIDYDKIVEVCQKVADQEFMLIESLAAAIYRQLQEMFAPARLVVRLTKPLEKFNATIEIGS